ncbi:3'(2'),5'-bisphosphate nucleotidase [Madurella fahalii]|uniref:3'(2'),5'-bisphosphate nucleotidase n=1 Tax=Madurella fahalii TaxID=1157608 RepID=A0ABQ0GJN4_9PEZI
MGLNCQAARRKTSQRSRNGATTKSTNLTSIRDSTSNSQVALPAAKPYAQELLIAELAVQRAAIVTKRVLRSLNLTQAPVTGGINQYLSHPPSPLTPSPSSSFPPSSPTVEGVSHAKLDKTPVTIADYAAQALLISAFSRAFPADAFSFIGEEDAGELGRNPGLAAQVWGLVSETRLDDAAAEAMLGRPASQDDMLALIGRCGKRDAPRKLAGRCWVMDPVDGTSAFLQGGQYAVALALVEGGSEKVGVLGCPNLRFEPPAPAAAGDEESYSGVYRVEESVVDVDGMGLMLAAVKGQGATVRPMGTGALAPAVRVDRRRLPAPALRDLNFVDSSNSPATWTRKVKRMAELTQGGNPGTDIYSSHMRYAAMVLGGRENVQVRVPQLLPSHAGAFWSIWDHAGSQLIYTESGPGKVTDIAGRPIQFDAGAKLKASWGVITADEHVYEDVFSLVTQMQSEDEEVDAKMAEQLTAAETAKKAEEAGMAEGAKNTDTARRLVMASNL